MSGRKGQIRDFKRYPKYKNGYILAFDKMLKARMELGRESKEEWKSGKDVFDWWTRDPTRYGQMDLFEEE